MKEGLKKILQMISNLLSAAANEEPIAIFDITVTGPEVRALVVRLSTILSSPLHVFGKGDVLELVKLVMGGINAGTDAAPMSGEDRDAELLGAAEVLIRKTLSMHTTGEHEEVLRGARQWLNAYGSGYRPTTPH